MTAPHARFFDLTPLPDQGVRVVTLWCDGDATATQTVERIADDRALLVREVTPLAPDAEADLAGRHWSLCECIRLGIAVFGEDPAASDEKEAHHGAA